MKDADRPARGREDPEAKPSRLEEAVRIIEEYAADLREIIKKLGRQAH
jgi:hypothetical protein